MWSCKNAAGLNEPANRDLSPRVKTNRTVDSQLHSKQCSYGLGPGGEAGKLPANPDSGPCVGGRTDNEWVNKQP